MLLIICITLLFSTVHVSSMRTLDYSSQSSHFANMLHNDTEYCINFVRGCTSMFQNDQTLSGISIGCDPIRMTTSCLLFDVSEERAKSGRWTPASENEIDMSKVVKQQVGNRYGCIEFHEKCRGALADIGGKVQMKENSCKAEKYGTITESFCILINHFVVNTDKVFT